MAKETSDEKLLKLIEGSARPKTAAQAGVKQKSNVLGSFLARLELNRFKGSLNLSSLSKGFFVLGGLLTLYFLYSFIHGILNPGELIFPVSVSSPAISKAKQEEERPLTREEYIGLDRRNIFLPFGQKSGASPEAPDYSELVKDLKLVGVLWSSEPEVMIESAKENRTYLLKKGETFGQQQFKVKNITRSSAVLEIPGPEGAQECELR